MRLFVCLSFCLSLWRRYWKLDNHHTNGLDSREFRESSWVNNPWQWGSPCHKIVTEWHDIQTNNTIVTMVQMSGLWWVVGDNYRLLAPHRHTAKDKLIPLIISSSVPIVTQSHSELLPILSRVCRLFYRLIELWSHWLNNRLINQLTRWLMN